MSRLQSPFPHFSVMHSLPSYHLSDFHIPLKLAAWRHSHRKYLTERWACCQGREWIWRNMQMFGHEIKSLPTELWIDIKGISTIIKILCSSGLHILLLTSLCYRMNIWLLSFLKKITLISCNFSEFTWYNANAMTGKKTDKSFADFGCVISQMYVEQQYKSLVRKYSKITNL